MTATSPPSAERGRRHSRPRAWIVTEVFWPEETSTGYFLTCLAEGLTAGREVGVLCGQPKYERRGERIPDREMHRGVLIRRCLGTTLSKDVLVMRAVNMLTIGLALLANGLLRFRRGDVVLVATNPPVLPYTTAVAARVRRARAVLMIQDVFPESLVAAGVAPRDSVVVQILAALAGGLYRLVDRIVVLGRDMDQLVRGKLGGSAARTKIVIIRNWADLEDVRPAERATNPLLAGLGLGHKFVVQYAGNIGRVQDIRTIAHAARALQATDPDVHFLFIGGGARRVWLEGFVRDERLANVTVLAPRPRADQRVFLNACDVTVSALMPGMYGVGVPSRMYNIMAAAKPMIAAVDADSEQALVIREENIGWVVPVGDAAAMAAAVRAAKADPAGLTRMGQRARRAAEEKYSMQAALDSYSALVSELTEDPA